VPVSGPIAPGAGAGAEWEYASRGGLDQKEYPWRDDEVDACGWCTNIWQGDFPRDNAFDDSYLTAAPVGSAGCRTVAL
jgi:sulfatase modifying factor 1